MLSLLYEALQDSTLHARPLTQLQQRLGLLLDSRYTYAVLLVLGVLRVILFAIAYPPAHGADSADYFLYAAQFEGLDAPIVFQLIYPLYPLFIYVTHYVLGSIYLLIGLQLVLSALQGAMIYAGLRPYSPALAFGMALLVLGDAQSGILYNFTSTEPFYMFLLSAAFSLYLFQLKHASSGRRVQVGDVLLGASLALVLLMRPVGRYLIGPFGLLFLLGTRSVWRTAVVATSYAVLLALSMLFHQVVFDRFELNGGGTFMLNRPLIKSGLLEAGNGPASARVIDLRATCPEGTARNRCYIEQTGGWSAVQKLHAEAYREMLKAHPIEYAGLVFDAFTEYLRLTGVQYQGTIKPSDVQCADLDTKTERDTTHFVETDQLLYGATDVTYDTLRPIVYDIAAAMCPPWPDSDTVSRGVDWLAVRYRSLSRPHPYIWYAVLGAAILAIPWARRFLFPVLVAGAILANHAAISALVFNIQPRYIVVANPYKGFLLLTLIYIAGYLALRVFDVWLTRRTLIARSLPDGTVQP